MSSLYPRAVGGSLKISKTVAICRLRKSLTIKILKLKGCSPLDKLSLIELPAFCNILLVVKTGDTSLNLAVAENFIIWSPGANRTIEDDRHCHEWTTAMQVYSIHDLLKGRIILLWCEGVVSKSDLRHVCNEVAFSMQCPIWNMHETYN
jgi:hypothetical protein